MHPKEIRKSKVFADLFEVDLGVKSAIQADMELNGFDLSQPLVLGEGEWTDKPVLVDGHMRLASALDAGIVDVPVVMRQFSTEQEAIEYAVHVQCDRRNLSEIRLLELAERFSMPAGKRGPRPAHDEQAKEEEVPNRADIEGDAVQAPYGKPVAHLAQTLGVSHDKAKRLQQVSRYATEEDRAEIAAGTLTISGAYERYLRRRWSDEQKEKRWHGRVQGHTRQLIALLQQLPKEVINEDTNRLLAALPKLIHNMLTTLPVLEEDTDVEKTDLLEML